MKSRIVFAAALVLSLAASPGARSQADTEAEAAPLAVDASEFLVDEKPSDGSRSRAVHHIEMYDELGNKILPGGEISTPDPMPFSARATCGRCHDYGRIASGWHFNSRDDSVACGRPAEPWIVADEKTGTQIPVTHRGWPGTWRPEEVGFTPWSFTQRFARHMPGGGMGEPRGEVHAQDSRWNVSGYLEINCLGCHSFESHQDQSEWALQVSRENFRWAATAAAGLGLVDGHAARQNDFYIVYDGPDPDNIWRKPPTIDYHDHLFDSKHRTFFDVTRRPESYRCYYCHTTVEVAEDGEVKEALVTDTDVHLRSGLACVDCHRNELDHKIVRGYRAEASECEDGDEIASLSCEGCHMGPDDRHPGPAMANRFGAPRPEHKGLPVVHFEKMTCTACHAGPWPEKEPGLVRTSRANRLGIHGKAQWYTDVPFIASPIFAPGDDGRLTPMNAVWPAFWGRLKDGEVTPILPEDVAAVAGEILEPEAQLANVAGVFGGMDPSRTAALALDGKVYRWYSAGCLEQTDVEADVKTADAPTWRWINEEGDLEPIIDADPLTWEVKSMMEPEPSQMKRIRATLGALEADGLVYGESACYGTSDTLFVLVTPVDEAGSSGESYVDVRDYDPSEQDLEPPFWGDMDADGAIQPIRAADVEYSLDSLIYAGAMDARDQIRVVLETLQNAGLANPVYHGAGKVFGLAEEEGEVVIEGQPPLKVTVLVELEEVEAPEGLEWGEMLDSEVRELVPAYACEAFLATFEKPVYLVESQVERVLKALDAGDDEAGDAVYVSSGRLRRLSPSGGLSAEAHEAAEPYMWAFGHDVRPAEQSLGSGGCKDCHAKGSVFYESVVAAVGPLQTDEIARATMASFEQVEEPTYLSWVGTVFRWFIIITMLFLIMHIVGDLMRRAVKRASR